MSAHRPGWLRRNVDLLAVAIVLAGGAAVNAAIGVVQLPIWRLHLDRGHFEEMRPAIMEIRDGALELRREAQQLRDEIREAVRRTRFE